MIVEIKNALALLVKEIVKPKASIVTSRWNESTSNRPQKDVEITITHLSDQYTKLGIQQYVRNYTFEIVIAVKNLKTDDEIQLLVDQLIYNVIKSKVYNQEIVFEKATNNGVDENSIWRYTLQVYIAVKTNTHFPVECDFSNSSPFQFDSVRVTVSPSYTLPD